MKPHRDESGLQPVFRFAPSPNGELHLGHVLSAIVGHDWARRTGGRFLVRIEDIDQSRARPDFESSILDDLAWLGLKWEEPVLRQSEHFDVYRRAADQLAALGVLYPCFATRSEIAVGVAARVAAGRPEERDPDGAPLYPGLHKAMSGEEFARRIAAGERPAYRLDMERALAIADERLSGLQLTFDEISAGGAISRVVANPARWGDVVLVRKDTPTSYHLSVVVDDARQAVTHVTRGQDLYPATDLHRLLQVLLALPEPVYHHHQLLLGPDGRKLAKSMGAPRLKDLRRAGVTPEEVRQMLGLQTAPL